MTLPGVMRRVGTRILAATLGASVSAAASYGLVELYALWYGPRYIKSDSDIGDAFMGALAFMLFCLVAGGVLGFRCAARRHLSGPRADAP